MEPSGKFNPLHECLRCGFHVYETYSHQGTLVHNLDGDIMRYGPDFAEKFEIDMHIDEDDLYGQPIKFCSINCALDTLSGIFQNDPKQFTMYCVMLSGVYNVSVPGLPPADPPKRYQVRKENLNNNPKSLERWGGTKTYEEYRVGFISPPCPFTAEFIEKRRARDKPLEPDEYPVSEKRMPEDDAAAEDEMQYFHELAEADLIEYVDPKGEPFDDGEFDAIVDPEFKK